MTKGTQHPDRGAQFHYLNEMVATFIDDAQLAIGVDAKKRLISDYANGGSECSPEGEPERVQVQDVAHTAAFLVNAIRRWWTQMGKARFSWRTAWPSTNRRLPRGVVNT